MLRVSLVGQAFTEVDATLITIDGATLACWTGPGAPGAGDGVGDGAGDGVGVGVGVGVDVGIDVGVGVDAGIDAGASGEEPVARYGLDQVLSIRLLDPPPAARPAARADPEHPNAFRRWTAEQEEAAIAGFHRGETMEEIAASVGRRVGGVRARLITLGVIEPEPGDRLRFPGAPALTAVAARDGGGVGPDAGGARPLLRAVELPREATAGREGD